jgi:hypothetical protein
MRTTLLSFSCFVSLLATACSSTPDANATPQSVVEAVAKKNPDCTRLTLHCTKVNASGPSVCASTAADKLGRPSDPEDLTAMSTGHPVVLEEGGALDVTVPIMMKDGKALAACGVTLKPGSMTREQTIERAKSIAKAVEASMPSCCAAGTCCVAGCCSK